MIGAYAETIMTAPASAAPISVTTPGDVEVEAIRWRAVHGVVPYFVWARLSVDERKRIALLTQELAQLMRIHAERVTT